MTTATLHSVGALDRLLITDLMKLLLASLMWQVTVEFSQMKIVYTKMLLGHDICKSIFLFYRKLAFVAHVRFRLYKPSSNSLRQLIQTISRLTVCCQNVCQRDWLSKELHLRWQWNQTLQTTHLSYVYYYYDSIYSYSISRGH